MSFFYIFTEGCGWIYVSKFNICLTLMKQTRHTAEIDNLQIPKTKVIMVFKVHNANTGMPNGTISHFVTYLLLTFEILSCEDISNYWERPGSRRKIWRVFVSYHIHYNQEYTYKNEPSF